MYLSQCCRMEYLNVDIVLYFVLLKMELEKWANIEDSLDDDVVIRVKDLKVWSPEEKAWWRRKPTKEKTMILKDVTGKIKEGEFAAVIGPSGAGKTTFLISLAGKCNLPSEGTVTVRGTNVKEIQDAVEIVPQFDVFLDGLCVMEHLVFMTEIKLGSHKDPVNHSIMNNLIEELKLKSHIKTPIKSLSGGERRLLSLATSLLSNPQILICDEPTTGLDSYNALLVVGALRMLSLNGRIVICSVHQPSCDLFKEFTTVMVMAEGRLLFHGSQDACKATFESISLRCPLNYNPAEFYIRAVSDANVVEKLVENNRRAASRDETSFTTREHRNIHRKNWLKEVHLLIWRLSLTWKRDIRNYLIQLFVTLIITSMVLSVAFWGVSGDTQRGVQDLRGFLWLVTSEVLFGLSYSALYTFEYEIALFKREVGMYHCSAYFVARFLSFIPRCIIWPISLVGLASIAVELPNRITTAIELITALTFSGVAAVAYGLGMAALFTSTGIMSDVMPCADLPLFLMSGAFLRISSMPSWLCPIKYLSHFYYAMDAVSNIYWRQIDYIDCPENTTSCVKDGAAVLLENGYSSSFILQDSLGLIFVTVFWALLGYYGLKREEKKGYAY